MWFRRRRRDDQPELVEIPIGNDRTFSSIVTAGCEAEGIPVRLLTMDEHGMVTALMALAEHRLLVRAADEERVREIVGRSA